MQSSKTRSPRQTRDSRVGNARTRLQLDLLERHHRAQYLGRAIRDSRVAREVAAKLRQTDDVARRDVARVSTIHQDQPIQLGALTDVAIALVGNVHRHELAQGGETRQRGYAFIVDIL